MLLENRRKTLTALAEGLQWRKGSANRLHLWKDGKVVGTVFPDVDKQYKPIWHAFWGVRDLGTFSSEKAAQKAVTHTASNS